MAEKKDGAKEITEKYPPFLVTYTGKTISRRAGTLMLKAYQKNHLNNITVSDAMYLLDMGVNMALITLKELVAKGLLTKAKGGGVYMGFLAPEEYAKLYEQLYPEQKTLEKFDLKTEDVRE